MNGGARVLSKRQGVVRSSAGGRRGGGRRNRYRMAEMITGLPRLGQYGWIRGKLGMRCCPKQI